MDYYSYRVVLIITTPEYETSTLQKCYCSIYRRHDDWRSRTAPARTACRVSMPRRCAKPTSSTRQAKQRAQQAHRGSHSASDINLFATGLLSSNTSGRRNGATIPSATLNNERAFVVFISVFQATKAACLADPHAGVVKLLVGLVFPVRVANLPLQVALLVL